MGENADPPKVDEAELREQSDAPVDGGWTLDQLLAAEKAGLRLKFVMFWGHEPPPSGEVGAHVLSQWYAQAFVVDGLTYATAEHFMMAEKARLFGDVEYRDRILNAETPGEAKQLGRFVRDFDETLWKAHRLEIVVRGSLAKFRSDETLHRYLLGTGERVLVEASPRDRVWGIGIGKHDPAAERPSQWQGQNLLGFALMRARAELAGRRQPDG